MKSVRLNFTKKGRMRFISHLDMTRFFQRAVKIAKIPVWYTEGFNPHPYIALPLPLSLGFTSDCEILDLKLYDDSFDENSICEKLNAVCGSDIRFFDCFSPILKPSQIGFASYKIEFDDGGKLSEALKEFLEKEQILSSKKTKKGEIKEIDLKPDIKDFGLQTDKNTVLCLTLPAGNDKSINPELFITSFYSSFPDIFYCYKINRTEILDKEGKIFK